MVERKVFYRGLDVEEVKKMKIEDYVKLLPARMRRTYKRGVVQRYEPLVKKIRAAKEGKRKKPIKTHARDMITIPEMIGLTIHVYDGKQYVPIEITDEMLGKYLGELTMTRRKVQHSAPGIGATKSSTAQASKAK